MLTFLFNLQLKLKNTIDVGIFGELAFPSTDGEITDQGSAKVQPEVIDKEGRFDDREENIEEGEGAEGGDDKVDLTSAESQDAQEKNEYKPKQRNGEDQNDKGTITSPNNTPFLDVESQCAIIEDEEPSVHGHQSLKYSALNVAKEPECISHPSSSLGESRKNTEVSIVIRSDLKDGDENRKQGGELQMLTVDKLSEQAENTNINDSYDVSIQSPPISSQTNPISFEQEKAEKKHLVMSTLAVPSVHYGPVPKRKELPAKPECKKTREKETLGKGLITAKKDSTEEFKNIVQHEDKHPGDDDDDEVISAEDLLCFSWQIAQGMVSRQPSGESHRL